MDLKKLDTRSAADAGREMIVHGPDNKPTDFKLILCGEDSKIYSKALFEYRREHQADDIPMIERIEAEIRHVVTECCVGWVGAEEDGVAVEFTKERVKQLFDDAPYILLQAYGFIRERSNFLTEA